MLYSCNRQFYIILHDKKVIEFQSCPPVAILRSYNIDVIIHDHHSYQSLDARADVISLINNTRDIMSIVIVSLGASGFYDASAFSQAYSRRPQFFALFGWSLAEIDAAAAGCAGLRNLTSLGADTVRKLYRLFGGAIRALLQALPPSPSVLVKSPPVEAVETQATNSLVASLNK